MKHLKTLLLTVLIAAMTLGLSLGIAACDSEKLVNYSVTVTCDDAEVLGGIKVQLKGEKGSSEEKTPVNGTASFELEAGTYTVNLTNVPTGYSYQEKTLTESAPSATVALVKTTSETVTYTVTVTCDDAEVLNAVTVKLQKGSESVAEKKLDNGKAVFDLAPGAYTVVLTGVPAGYTFESKALSSTVTETTVALTKNVTAITADVTVKTAAGEDVFGNEQPETALKYVTLELYASEEDQAPQATATTDENGVAHFDAVTPGSYLVSVNGAESGTLTIGGPTATLELHAKLGSKAAPLAWKVGENEVPLTQEILEELGDEFVYYTLLVEESGLYSFDADQDSVNVSGDVLGTAWTGPTRHITAQLEADVVYTFACSSMGAAEGGSFGYKVTVTKGNTSTGGGDTPDIPWTTGSGTKEAPYISTSLKGTYRVPVKFENGKYVPVYFQYTETAAAKYAIYSSDQNFFMTVGDRSYVGGGNASSELSLFQTEASKTYLFEITPYDDEGTSDVTVSFTIGDYTGYFPKWEGSGVFQTAAGYEKDDPFIVTTLVDDYEAHGADRVYFKYEATETKNYTVTLISEEEDTLSIDFLLRNYNGGKPDAGTHYLLTKTENSAVISLTAGTTYLFGVSGEDSDMEAHVKIMKFKITEGGTPSTGGPDAPGDGSKSKPFQIADILAENTLQVTANGYYYTFRVTEDGTYTFTAKTALLIKDFQGSNGQTLAQFTGSKVGATKDYELFANIDYTFNLMGFGPDAGSEVKLQAELKAKVQEAVLPSEFDGNWNGVGNDYTLSIGDGRLTLKKSGAAVETVVTSKESQTMAGKTSYYVTFEGKTYTLNWNSAGEKMLQLYLDPTTALYFAPDPLPAFTFEESLCGEYVDREGKLPDHIVVSANGISWANHTIVLVSDMSGSDYPGYDKAIAAYVDGKPDLILFTNDSILFRDENVWFDNVEEGTITLPAEYIGKWKSADGKYTLELTANTATLQENGSPVTATFKAEKKGSYTVYYLTYQNEDHELIVAIPGILGLVGSTSSVYFSIDPKPMVDLSKIEKGYYATESTLTYLVIGEDSVTWGEHVFELVGPPQTESTSGTTGYPVFMDGKPYILMVIPSFAGGGLMLNPIAEGDSWQFTFVGTSVSQENGSESSPYVLQKLLGEHTFENVNASAGTWYAFDLAKDATITITSGSEDFDLEIGNAFMYGATVGRTKDFNLKAGLIKFHFTSAKEDRSPVTVKITISYKFTANVTGGDSDIYGNAVNAVPKADVDVSLYKGEELVKTEKTNSSGVSTFLVTEEGDYSVKVDDKSYSFDGTVCNVNLVSKTVYGTQDHPLTLSFGANEIPLTFEILESYNGAFYSFTPVVDGKYLFIASEQYAQFILFGEEGMEGMPLVVVGGSSIGFMSVAEAPLSGEAQLKRGVTYLALAVVESSLLPPDAQNFAYTVTISFQSGEKTGSGTEQDPEILTDLNTILTRTVNYADKYYFKITASETCFLDVSAMTTTTLGGDLFSNVTASPTATQRAQLKKGSTYTLWIRPLKTGTSDLTIILTTSESPDIPWTGNGTKDDPYVVENVTGEFEVFATTSKYPRFKFTATKDATYKITLLSSDKVTIYLPSGVLFDGTKKPNSALTENGSDTFSVTANEEYVFYVYPTKTGVVKFKIEEVVS